MKKKILFLIIISNLSFFAQPLRKNVLSVASGYVLGYNSFTKGSSSQIILWGNYLFSSLHEISAVYKKFNLENNGNAYKEDFFAIKGKVNLFPFYFSLTYGKLNGVFSPAKRLPDFISYFFNGKATYYNHLIFYSLSSEYVNIAWKKEEKIFSGMIEITWRPSKYFAFTIGGLTSGSNMDSSYTALSLELFWQPFQFLNISAKSYFGKHRFYYDADYMIMYNFPYTETGASSFYLRIYPWHNLGIILNYEHRNYEFAFAEFYSLSLRYNLNF